MLKSMNVKVNLVRTVPHASTYLIALGLSIIVFKLQTLVVSSVKLSESKYSAPSASHSLISHGKSLDLLFCGLCNIGNSRGLGLKAFA